MKYEVIFCIFALVLTAGVVGAFAWALLGHSKGGRAEEARTADNLAGLREEYAHLVEQQAAGRLTQAAFAEREEELALRVLEETEETKDSADPSQVRKDADNARTSLITTAAVAVMIPATAAGAYLWYGDFPRWMCVLSNRFAWLRRRRSLSATCRARWLRLKKPFRATRTILKRGSFWLSSTTRLET